MNFIIGITFVIIGSLFIALHHQYGLPIPMGIASIVGGVILVVIVILDKHLPAGYADEKENS